MRTHTLLVLGLLALIGAPGCAGSKGLASPPASAMAFDGGDATTPRNRRASAETTLLVKSASLHLEVESVEGTRNQAVSIVENFGGRVDRTSASGEERVAVGLRVPVDQLETALASLAALGEVVSRHVSVDDVSDQVIDLDARIANLRALRDRMRLLLDRATEIKDILAIERELTRVQSELDSLTGRVDRLRDHAALSRISLTLELQEPKRILGPVGFVGYWTWKGIEKLFVIRHGPD